MCVLCKLQNTIEILVESEFFNNLYLFSQKRKISTQQEVFLERDFWFSCVTFKFNIQLADF